MSHRATVGGSTLGLAVGWNVSNVGANALALIAPEPALLIVARTLTAVGTARGFVAGS